MLLRSHTSLGCCELFQFNKLFAFMITFIRSKAEENQVGQKEQIYKYIFVSALVYCINGIKMFWFGFQLDRWCSIWGVTPILTCLSGGDLKKNAVEFTVISELHHHKILFSRFLSRHVCTQCCFTSNCSALWHGRWSIEPLSVTVAAQPRHRLYIDHIISDVIGNQRQVRRSACDSRRSVIR